MALSGIFYKYEVSQFGLYCEWSGVPNKMTNSTRVSVNVYLRYYNIAVGSLNGSVGVGAESQTFTTTPILDDTANVWHNRHLYTFAVDVQHNNDGTKNGLVLSATLAFNGVYMDESIGNIIATTTVDLDAIVIYKLYTTIGSNSSIVVNRISSYFGSVGNITNNATLYYGDRLEITFSVSDGYQIAAHTVNGFTFTSGDSIIVEDDIVVVSSAQAIAQQSILPENIQCFDTKNRPIKALWQWDRYVSIVIKDAAISPPPIFQFANRLSQDAISVESIIRGNDLVAEIPSVLLERPESVFAYIYSDSGNGVTRTLGSVHIPVRARKPPGSFGRASKALQYITGVISNTSFISTLKTSAISRIFSLQGKDIPLNIGITADYNSYANIKASEISGVFALQAPTDTPFAQYGIAASTACYSNIKAAIAQI